jgi:hypothetical protein
MKISETELVQLLPEVAKRLGAGWTYTPDPESSWKNHMLRGPSGEELHIGPSQNQDGKLYVSGSSDAYSTLSRYETEAAPMPNIGVAYARGAEAIAREIQRRILPDYYKAVMLANNLTAERDQRSLSMFTVVESIENALAPKHKRTHNKESLSTSDPREVYIDASELGWTVRINSADSIEFSLKYLTAAHAIKLAAFLSTL